MKAFLILYGVFVLLASVLLINYPKQELFLLLNQRYSDLGDLAFPYVTLLGGGILSALAVVALMFVAYRWAVVAAVSFVLSGLIVQLLKHAIFSDCLRPLKLMQGNLSIHTVPGVDVFLYNSFPSGHATTAFSLFFLLAIILRGRSQIWGVFFFIIALIAAYSRIYLAQHFLADILAGSAIGIGSTYCCYVLLNNPLIKKKWAARRLGERKVQGQQ